MPRIRIRARAGEPNWRGEIRGDIGISVLGPFLAMLDPVKARYDLDDDARERLILRQYVGFPRCRAGSARRYAVVILARLSIGKRLGRYALGGLPAAASRRLQFSRVRPARPCICMDDADPRTSNATSHCNYSRSPTRVPQWNRDA